MNFLLKPFWAENDKISASEAEISEEDEAHYYGKEYLVAEASQELLDRSMQAEEQMQALTRKSWLSSAFGVCLCVIGFLTLGIFFKIMEEYENYEAAVAQHAYLPYMIVVGGLGIMLWIAWEIWQKIRSKARLESEEYLAAKANFERTEKAVLESMEIPTDAEKIDVLLIDLVKDKKTGEIKLDTAPYLNFDFYCYTDHAFLYLALSDSKYAFPKEKIKVLHSLEGKYSVNLWNKDVTITDRAYQSFHLEEDKYGTVHFQTAYALQIGEGEDAIGIYFPSYELPAIERLTGLSPKNI